MVRKTNIVVKINMLFIFFSSYPIQTTFLYNVSRLYDVRRSEAKVNVLKAVA